MEPRPTSFNPMQSVKRQLFAMRNGIIAETLRKAGSPFKMIFGVNLPQLVDIANATGKDRQLAEELWLNSSTRESMLLAPMIMPTDDFTRDDALRWIQTVPTAEVADILCHRLLRHMPYALDLAAELAEMPDQMPHYTGLRLMCNLGSRYPDQAYKMGQKELALADPHTRMIAQQLISYAEL